MLLDELLNLYLETTTGVRSPNTERLFRTVMRHWTRWLGHPANVSDFSERALVAYMRARRLLGRADATIDNEGVKLLVLWRFAAKQGLCAEPTISISRAKPDAPQALMRHQVRALFRAAAKSKREVAGHQYRLYFPALLGVIWATGERITAVCELERKDIDVRSRSVTFRKRKGRGGALVKTLPRMTCWAVKKWLKVAPEQKPFSVVAISTLYYHLEQVMIAAEIPVNRRNKFHALRRSHASYLKLAGGDATQSLGHDSERTTRTHYYDPRIVHRRSAASYLFNPFGWWSRVLAVLGL